MELVLPMYNAHPYFSLKNLGKRYSLYMTKYSSQFNVNTQIGEISNICLFMDPPDPGSLNKK